MGPQKAGFLALVRKDQEGLNGDKNGFRLARSWVESGERGKETIQSVAVVRLIPGELTLSPFKNGQITPNYLELARLFLPAGKKRKHLQNGDLGLRPRETPPLRSPEADEISAHPPSLPIRSSEQHITVSAPSGNCGMEDGTGNE